VAALLGLVDIAAVELYFTDVVARIETDLEELRAGIYEIRNQVAHGLLALLCQASNLICPTEVVGLFAVLHQFGILSCPVLQV
jgi:acyl-CoA hydrolase